MIDPEIRASLPIEWGVAMESHIGETASGDKYLVKPFANGALIGVVDGLGHGEQAAIVSQTVITALEAYTQEPLPYLFEHCHRLLKSSRGVVMSLALFNWEKAEMSWLGVGNVSGHLLRGSLSAERKRETLLLRGGVVGYRLPTLRLVTLRLGKGDLLVLATDGLQSSFTKHISQYGPPQQIADNLLKEHGRDHDDSLVLVIRYK